MERNEARDDELIIPSPFKPLRKWRKEEGSNVLEVHLRGFKSEEVTVELIGRNLHIRGESTSLSNSRFHIETKIPRDCTIDQIRSKFDGGILYITVPTKDPWSSTVSQQITTLTGQAASMVQTNVGGQNAPDSDSPVRQPTSHPSDGN
ncbi:hypothetical protein FH972_010622 [Carpinus fangiana]|uniref:SHSP domain-containing protein n=1 Tax=Carpinus fangiana TaxID=176857 RepID=A0A660KRM9_9ROSI|nr:hypothetical protein FH972_010622 [Carpinus fangiana]